MGLAPHIVGLSPHHIEDDEWTARVEVLQQRAIAKDADGILAWLDRELPRCMGLVPSHARQNFASGIIAAVWEDELDLTKF